MVWTCAWACGETAAFFAGLSPWVHGPAALFQSAAFVYACWFAKRHCSNARLDRSETAGRKDCHDQ